MRARTIALLAFISSLLIGGYYFRQSPAAFSARVFSPDVVVEEDVCGRVGTIPKIVAAQVSLDRGATWQSATNQGKACAVFLDMSAFSQPQEAVFLAVSREGGTHELWRIWAEGQALISESDAPFVFENRQDSGVVDFLTLAAGGGGDAAPWGIPGALALITVILLALILIQEVRQMGILDEIRKTNEQNYYIAQRSQRLDTELSELPAGPLPWLASHFKDSFGVYPELNEAAVRVLEQYPVVYGYTSKGNAYAVSPYGRKELLKKFSLHLPRRMRKSKLGKITEDQQAEEIVKKGRVSRHALGKSGETFDIEARLLARALDFDWGQPNILYFYLTDKAG